MKKTLAIISLLLVVCGSWAQDAIDQRLSRHNFFYAGQSKQRRMFIVKDGQVNWAYQDQLKKGEISDAVLMSDGHILVAHQYGVAEVTQTSETVWSYAAPEGTEIHTIQPIGRTHVVFVQNGKPAKAVVMEVPSCRIVRESQGVGTRTVPQCTVHIARHTAHCQHGDGLHTRVYKRRQGG